MINYVDLTEIYGTLLTSSSDAHEAFTKTDYMWVTNLNVFQRTGASTIGIVSEVDIVQYVENNIWKSILLNNLWLNHKGNQKIVFELNDKIQIKKIYGMPVKQSLEEK